MTARYPSQHGAGLRIPREIEFSDLVTPPGRRAHGHSGLAPSEVTLAQLLATAGYETAGFHRNLLFDAELGFARGFDRYEYYRGEDLAGGIEGAELAREWMRARSEAESDSPFFLLFHLMDPHLPFRMRNEYYDAFGPPLLPANHTLDPAQPFVSFHDWTRQRVENDADLARVIAMYDSEIAYADRAFGMVLEELERAGDTILVLLSDHGEGFGEHGKFEHGNSMYDELLRVPLYLRLPDRQGASSVIEDPVSLLDVVPTLLQLIGRAPLEVMEGTPLPGLAPAPGSERPRSGLLAEGTFLGPDQTALIRDGYKYVLTHPQGYLGFQDGGPEQRRARARRPAREELYRLEEDPEESRDLASVEMEITRSMRDAVREHLETLSRGLHVRCGGEGRASLGLTLEMNATHRSAVEGFGRFYRGLVDRALAGRRGSAGGDRARSAGL
jgi:arylsulfatase A-like enzyme